MSEPGEPEYLEPRVVHNGPILLVEPDPAWASQFTRARSRIRAALGRRAVGIEHVGSTSIPGLPAKPILDIVLVVTDSSDESSYVPDLIGIGYRLRLREPHWHEHRLLRHDEPSTNLHVFGAGSPEVERMTLFRDQLRRHPEERERYARVKRELAAREWEFVQDYADAKSAVVEDILARAASPT